MRQNNFWHKIKSEIWIRWGAHSVLNVCFSLSWTHYQLCSFWKEKQSGFSVASPSFFRKLSTSLLSAPRQREDITHPSMGVEYSAWKAQIILVSIFRNKPRIYFCKLMFFQAREGFLNNPSFLPHVFFDSLPFSGFVFWNVMPCLALPCLCPSTPGGVVGFMFAAHGLLFFDVLVSWSNAKMRTIESPSSFFAMLRFLWKWPAILWFKSHLVMWNVKSSAFTILLLIPTNSVYYSIRNILVDGL